MIIFIKTKMNSCRNGAIFALFFSQFAPDTNALKLTNLNEHKIEANGIFGKMIEMSTAGEAEEKERHQASMRKK